MSVQPARAERTTPKSADTKDFRADYGDAFRIAATSDAAVREWARLSLRGAEGPFGDLVWHGVLGFRLASKGTPGTLVGWHVAVDEPDRFVVESDGRLMAGRMIFETGEADLTWTTMLRFHNPVARIVWAVVGNAHRALAPRCLEIAARADSARSDRGKPSRSY